MPSEINGKPIGTGCFGKRRRGHTDPKRRVLRLSSQSRAALSDPCWNQVPTITTKSQASEPLIAMLAKRLFQFRDDLPDRAVLPHALHDQRHQIAVLARGGIE